MARHAVGPEQDGAVDLLDQRQVIARQLAGQPARRRQRLLAGVDGGADVARLQRRLRHRQRVPHLVRARRLLGQGRHVLELRLVALPVRGVLRQPGAANERIGRVGPALLHLVAYRRV